MCMNTHIIYIHTHMRARASSISRKRVNLYVHIIYKYIGVIYVEHRDTHGRERERLRRRLKRSRIWACTHRRIVYYLSRERRRKKAGENTTRMKLLWFYPREGTRACFYYRESRSRKVKLDAWRVCMLVCVCMQDWLRFRGCFGSVFGNDFMREWFWSCLCCSLDTFTRATPTIIAKSARLVTFLLRARGIEVCSITVTWRTDTFNAVKTHQGIHTYIQGHDISQLEAYNSPYYCRSFSLAHVESRHCCCLTKYGEDKSWLGDSGIEKFWSVLMCQLTLASRVSIVEIKTIDGI